jgi:hypothetical protein
MARRRVPVAPTDHQGPCPDGTGPSSHAEDWPGPGSGSEGDRAMPSTAIAQVTLTLKELIKANLESQATVSLLQPSDTLPTNSVNLFLYRVVENAQLKNMDWRGDRSRPAGGPPALALELYYLLTPFADPPAPDTVELPRAHSLLGQAMQALHEHPVLTKVHLPSFDFDALPQVSDLRDAYDDVIVRLLPLDTDELSKIWAMFDEPYRLSVAYQVSVVQLPPTAPPRARAAPVDVTVVDVDGLEPPRVTGIQPLQAGTGASVTLGGTRLVQPGVSTRVRLGGRLVEPSSVTPGLVDFTVPADLEAGPEQEVRVVVGGRASNALTFQVFPWLRKLEPVRGAPGPDPATAVALTLEVAGVDLTTAGAVSVLFGGVSLTPTLEPHRCTVTVPPSRPNGSQPVRIVVDGHASGPLAVTVVGPP